MSEGQENFYAIGKKVGNEIKEKISEGFVLDTPEKVEMARLISLKHALRLKVNTGMDMSRGISLVKIAKGYGFTGRTNKSALDYVESLITELTE